MADDCLQLLLDRAELVRTDAGWKLRKITLTISWSRGNPKVPRIALARGRAKEGGD